MGDLLLTMSFKQSKRQITKHLKKIGMKIIGSDYNKDKLIIKYQDKVTGLTGGTTANLDKSGRIDMIVNIHDGLFYEDRSDDVNVVMHVKNSKKLFKAISDERQSLPGTP